MVAVPSEVEPPDEIAEEDGFVRADMFDLSTIDIRLEEKMAARAFGKGICNGCGEKPKAAWEIDLSKLRRLRQVAKGFHGTLFRADYDGRDVAVKLVEWGNDGYSTPDQIAHLRTSLKEVAAAWHEIDHPNIAKFIGASMGTSDLNVPPGDQSSASGTDNYGTSPPPADRACCVVVEYITGGTLKSHLIKHFERKLPYKEAVRLALAMARGLSYLHFRKIMHRDVKTENMLLDDGKLNLKIADFGVARIEVDPRDMTGATGTPRYMAPEVLAGRPYNRKCDVYSFAIGLWEIYCCQMPYEDLDSFPDIVSAVVYRNQRPEIPRCCPPDMAYIMRRCWDADPAARPDMEEVVRLLEGLDTRKGRGMVPLKESAGCFCFALKRRGS